MKIEVRNVKVAKFASRETLCFTAQVILDGKVVGTAMNDGHGGANLYEPRGLYDRLETHAKTLPDITTFATPLRMTADLVIDFLVQDFLAAKDFKKTIASRVLCVDSDGKVVQTKKLPKGTDIETVARTFVGKPGVAHVLNLLPEDKALAIFTGKARA
jgi:hypothetical protein